LIEVGLVKYILGQYDGTYAFYRFRRKLSRDLSQKPTQDKNGRLKPKTADLSPKIADLSLKMADLSPKMTELSQT